MTETTDKTATLAELQENAGEVLRRAREGTGPLVLTTDAGEFVIADAAAYKHLLERMEFLENVEKIREGLADVQTGGTKPMREALEDLAQHHGFSCRDR